MTEYPKALYIGDECKIVADAEEEAEARKDGFRFWSDPDEAPAPDGASDIAPVKRGPGRPPGKKTA